MDMNRRQMAGLFACVAFPSPVLAIEKLKCSCGADCDFGPNGCSSVVKIAGIDGDCWVHSCLAHIDKARAKSTTFLDPDDWVWPGP